VENANFPEKFSRNAVSARYSGKRSPPVFSYSDIRTARHSGIRIFGYSDKGRCEALFRKKQGKAEVVPRHAERKVSPSAPNKKRRGLFAA